MTTSKKQTLEPTEEQLTFFPVGSRNHASHSRQPGSERAQKMTATSGHILLEQLEKSNHVGLWARTFLGLLVGMGEWYSTRCYLTWKAKDMRPYPLLYQLVPKTPRTEGTESGLLPTPQAIDGNGQGRSLRLKKDCNRDPEQPGSWRGDLKDYATQGLLPTPTVSDIEGGVSDPRQIHKKNGRYVRKSDTTGTEFGAKLRDVAGLLPTPTSTDYKGASSRTAEKGRNPMTNNLPDAVAPSKTGKTSQLNPRFCLEMMGFPPNWTELPFLSGETNQSKEQGTP